MAKSLSQDNYIPIGELGMAVESQRHLLGLCLKKTFLKDISSDFAEPISYVKRDINVLGRYMLAMQGQKDAVAKALGIEADDIDKFINIYVNFYRKVFPISSDDVCELWKGTKHHVPLRSTMDRLCNANLDDKVLEGISIPELVKSSGVPRLIVHQYINVMGLGAIYQVRAHAKNSGLDSD